MFVRTRVLAAFIIGIMTLQGVWLPPASAVIPNSNDPDAYTEKDYRLAVLEIAKQTMSGAYLKVGHRDPRWDDLVVELLDAQAQWFSNHEAHNTDAVPVSHSMEQISGLTEALRGLGCDDPLVLYLIMRYTDTSDPGYLDLARSANKALAASEYPVIRRLAAARWLYRSLKGPAHEEERTEMTGSLVRLCVESVIGEPMSTVAQRNIEGIVIETLEMLPLDRWKMLAEQIELSDSPNRWLIDVVIGKYHLTAAWEARGGGWAHEVTEAGWASFAEHLNIAEVYLSRAWKSEPTLPEAPAVMIKVAMGRQTGEERLWFDRATEAQFDYKPAYWHYIWSIRPRWGGSHHLMHAFATECLATNRFDTYVPCFFYDIMTEIVDDSGDYQYWAKPGVYEQFVAYFRGRKNEPNPSDPEAWWDSITAVLAWRVGRYQEAMDQMQAMGDRFNPRPFTFFKSDAVLGPSELHARTGQHAEVVTESARLWYKQDYLAAHERVEQVLANAPDDDPARPYLQKQAARAGWLHGQSSGDWVDLLDRTDLGGWQQERGAWSVDGQGRITGRSDGNGLLLSCRHPFGYRVEIRGTITFQPIDTPSWYNGGILLGFWWWSGHHYHRDILLFPNLDKAAAMRHFFYDKAFYPAEMELTNTFHIQMWNEHVRLYVNDELVIEHRKMLEELRDEVYPFALGSTCTGEGIEVRYDKLEVRPLFEEPDWTGTEQTAFTTTGDSE